MDSRVTSGDIVVIMQSAMCCMAWRAGMLRPALPMTVASSAFVVELRAFTGPHDRLGHGDHFVATIRAAAVPSLTLPSTQ